MFVYGTLKPGEVNYSPYCQGKVIEAIRGYTRGRLYTLSLGYPAMTEGEGKVRGFLLTFADRAILADLDQLEDFQAERSPEDNEYQRRLTIVYQLSGKLLGEAWCYFMTPAKIKQLQGVLLPSGWWQGKN